MIKLTQVRKIADSMMLNYLLNIYIYILIMWKDEYRLDMIYEDLFVMNSLIAKNTMHMACSHVNYASV